MNWVASRPGCHFDCAANWICSVNTEYHEEMVVNYICIYIYIYIYI